MTRVLLLVRHAKAESYAATDHERPLSDRGVTEAAAAGTWLAARDVAPQRALVSDALRTRQTFEAMAVEAGWTIEPEYDSTLYEADAETVLDVVRGLDDDVSTVLVVGHNPTMAYLAQVL